MSRGIGDFISAFMGVQANGEASSIRGFPCFVVWGVGLGAGSWISIKYINQPRWWRYNRFTVLFRRPFFVQVAAFLTPTSPLLASY